MTTVTTLLITGITNISAMCGGAIINDAASITAKGICWGTSTNPTISLATKTIDGTGNDPFVSYLLGLNANTTYYVRAYATNSVGTVYGSSLSFTTTNILFPVNVTTLDKIVESMKMQLKPHLTDDVIISEKHITDMLNQTRSQLISKLYIAGNNLNPFYQEVNITTTSDNSHDAIPTHFPFQIGVLPDMQILGGQAGHKNISYVGSSDYSLTNIEYVEFEEFQNYSSHRFGKTFPCYTNQTNRILFRNTTNTNWLVRAIFLNPLSVPGYDSSVDIYPIDGTLLRQLELLTFQHLAAKLGLPQDVFNNASDETKNAPAMQGQKQQQSSDDDQQQ